MAKNQSFPYARQLNLAVASGVLSGDPVVFGQRPGVALADRDSSGKAPVTFEGVFALSVKGIDGSGNLAIAAGDILYFTAGDTPHLSVKNTGVRFGYAAAAVTSGATSTIDVILGY